MPDGSKEVIVKVLGSVHDVPALEWDACAGAGNPFVCHAFFAALEGSGSVAGSTGWRARHLAVFGDDGRLHGCMPLYLKSHSYGEFVFDWGWAEAFERAGGSYYPKLQAAVPFTPVTGRRLLIRPDAADGVFDALAEASLHLARRLGASSVHVTFLTEAEALRLADRGFMLRLGHQYHWENRGYRHFDDFLVDLASRKRKAIRKERQGVAESGIVIRALAGADIEERHWEAFYRFYLDTVDRKWAHAYLTRDVFTRLSETMAERMLLVIAETPAGEPVGGALNVIGEDTLYGRYWGCAEHYRFLHFEVCYYQAIAYAIEHGLARVEAGAQGAHKVQRGYLPQPTWSAHWIAHAGLRRAVERFLAAERRAVEEEMRALAAETPFRCADNRRALTER
jgi:uncharacterized protein